MIWVMDTAAMLRPCQIDFWENLMLQGTRKGACIGFQGIQCIWMPPCKMVLCARIIA
jgi:hypothetical protein